ncbi:MAG: hypothetical protein RR033_04495 [Clostridia bacterium]
MQLLLAVSLNGISKLDIGIAVLLLLGLLIGVSRGFAKTFRGGTGSLFALAAGVAGLFLLVETVSKQSFCVDIQKGFSSLIDKLGVGFSSSAKVENGAIFVLVNGNYIAFKESFTGVVGTIAGLAEGTLIKVLGAGIDGVASISTLLAVKLTAVVVKVGVFVVTCIVAKIAFSILSKILISLVQGKKTLCAIDRVLGLTFSFLLVSVIVLGAFYFIKQNPTVQYVAQIQQMIDGSNLAKWLYNNNPLFELLQKFV